MNKVNTEKLFKDFPGFFSDRSDHKKSLMGFGFACGDGWYQLIYKLCEDIDAILKEMGPVPYPKDPDWYFQVEQVKEKFAGLRFYISSAPRKIHDLIAKAEDESYHICEECGRSGEMKVCNYWYVTLCPECSKKKEKQRGCKVYTIKDSHKFCNRAHTSLISLRPMEVKETE